MNLRTIITTIAAITLTGFTTGCENQETVDMAKAQDCLNKATPSTAASCVSIIASYNSAKANAIKCGATLLSGGLTTEKLASAFANLSNGSYSTPEAALMTVTAMEGADITAAMTKANNAKEYCSKSEQRSLNMLGSLAVMGTPIAYAVPGFDPANPSSLNSSNLQTIITSCSGGGGCPTEITDNQEAIGSAVITMSESYCGSAPDNDEMCNVIESTIADAGGVPATVGEALFCYLEGKVWNGSACVAP